MNLFSQLLNVTRPLLFKIEHKTFPYPTCSSKFPLYSFRSVKFFQQLSALFLSPFPSPITPIPNHELLNWLQSQASALTSPSKELLQRSSVTSMLLSPWTYFSSLFLPLFYLSFLMSWFSFWRTSSLESGSWPPLQAHLLHQASTSLLALLLRPVSS